MDLKTVLSEYRFPKDVKDVLAARGFKSLYPPQSQAIAKGALQDKSLVMSVPTAAGKTLIAELCILHAIKRKKGRCLYIAPLKALVNEKYNDFREKYEPLGIKVGKATGDLDVDNKFLSRNQVLVATAEKIDSLLRAKAKWLVNSLAVVVLDEVHFIHDEERGPTLEILTARIRQLNPRAQILALSATVSNAEQMAGWLKAELVASDWRPIPLEEGVYFNEQIKFLNGPARLIKEDTTPDDVGKLALDTLRGKGQVLVFVGSRRSAQAASRQLCPSVSRVLSPDEKKKLAALAKDVLGPPVSATKICRKLAESVAHGVAFHHAGLKPKQRDLIEKNFKGNLIKVICSTPTLAAGVNLPARRVIVRDVKRFETGLGSSYIPTFEYKQCAGRAGRPQYDKSGESILVAKSPSESRTLFSRYIKAEPEPILSKLGNESALRIHILASIAGDYVHDINDTFEFLSYTFLAHQKNTSNLIEMVGNIFEFLEAEEFIEKKGFRYFATAFGQYTSRLYVDPVSSIVLREGLKKIGDGKSFSSIGILHMLACCPDGPLLHFGKSDAEDIEEFAAQCQDEFILTAKELPELNDYLLNLSILKTTSMLRQWIEEDKEEAICDRFNIGPGDIYRHTEAAQWLLHAAVIFADLFNLKKMTIPLENLRKRVRYGIQEQLLELALLKGIGRVRARVLFENGIKNFADVKRTPQKDLAELSKIGKALAKDLHDQVSGKSYYDKIKAMTRERMEQL